MLLQTECAMEKNLSVISLLEIYYIKLRSKGTKRYLSGIGYYYTMGCISK